MKELIQIRHGAFHTLMRESDRVVALCRWTRDLLIRNGVSEDKIMLSPHGLPLFEGDPIQAAKELLSLPEKPLRIVFLGRLDPSKGAEVLVRALRLLPTAHIELHIYGVAQGEEGMAHLRALQSAASGDTRLHFHPPVASEDVVPLLAGYDLLAAPSQLLETGPLVVLEAFEAGIPVMGSNLGGIAELVRDEIDGLLLKADSAQAWAAGIRRCLEEDELLPKLRRFVRRPRRMETVAREMVSLYELALRGEGSHAN
jgi:glycosyltransferase involved in cell wall biosynthesis